MDAAADPAEELAGHADLAGELYHGGPAVLGGGRGGKNYQVAVAARSSAGGRSALSDVRTVSITNNVPGPVSAVSATPMGRMPARSF